MLRSRLLATALAASALVTPAAASADWQVETLGQADYSEIDVALAGTGDLALRSSQRAPATGATRGVMPTDERLRVRAPGGTFATSDGADRDHLLGTRDGRLEALGYADGRIVGGSVFGPLAPITPDDAALSAHAASTGGAVVATYTTGDSVRVVVRPAGGTFSAPVDLAPNTANFVELGVADDGRAVATWERYVDSMPVQEYRVRSAAGTWGPPVVVAGRHGRVAMGPDGDALLVVFGDTHVRAMTMRSGGTFGPLTDVAPLGQSAGWSIAAMGPDGIGAVSVHQQAADGTRTFGVRRFDGTSFGPLQDLRSGTSDSTVALVADDAAHLWFASVASDDGGNSGRILVRRAAGATFGPAEPVNAPTPNVSGQDVRFATDGHGGAALAWSDGIGADERLRLATTGLPGPAPAGDERTPPATPHGAPAPGAAPVPGTAPVAVPRAAAAVKATKLTRLGVTVRRGRVTVSFRASARAKVTLVVERRAGRRWVRAKRVTVTAKAGTNRAAVGTVKRGRYRVTAAAGQATARAAFRVR